MTDNDIGTLRSWLRRKTINRHPTPENNIAAVSVDFVETTAAKLHFFYPDGSGMCIKLESDGTWTYTCGQ